MSSKYSDLPEPIPDTPENIARACMQGPPKKEWRFLKNKENLKATSRKEENADG